MRRALGNQEFPLGTFAGQLVDETVGVGDAATPEAVKVLQRFGLADAGVAAAHNVLDEGIDALQGLFVFQLPARVFIPGAWGEDDLHRGFPYASMSSWACPLPRSSERIDFARTRWLASDQKGSGLSVITSKGRRRRMTDWRRKSRMALDMSSPALEKSISASFRRLESIRTCSDDVVILKSFVVQMVYSIRFMADERKTAWRGLVLVCSVCRRDALRKTKFSEGRLRSNGEAARKGPRGFSVFSGSKQLGNSDL